MLGFLRARIRGAVATAFGPGAEVGLHVLYHRTLRAAGLFGVPEPKPVIEALDFVVRTASSVVDAGANIGRYSWFFATRAKKDARIYAFEPNPAAFRLLEANLERRPVVRLFNCALGARTETAYLNVPTDGRNNPVTALGWVSNRKEAGSESNRNAVVQETTVCTLDAAIARGDVSLRRPLFFKIDVEGGEMDVLSGAAATIEKWRPLIYFECEQRHLTRSRRDWRPIWSYFAAAGYAIFAASEAGFTVAHALNAETNAYFAVPGNDADDPASPLAAPTFIAMLRRHWTAVPA
ncbi:MAG: FkbM family methyltransferase [Pseudomonadota bacterium]